MRRILIVDDQAEAFAETYGLLFPADRPTLCTTGAEALALLAEDTAFDVVLLDVRMPAQLGSSDEEEGLAVLAAMKEERPELPVILLSVISDVETVVRGMRNGAYYYVEKPPDPQRLRHLVNQAIDHARVEAEGRALRASIDERDRIDDSAPAAPGEARLGALVGSSEVMRALYTRVRRAAASDATVLVLGESGTGKELAATELHRLSGRADGPFRVVNCPALPKDLLESTLFGHRKGAFTGATEDRKGEFVLADGGTLFLDEIGDLGLDLQAKLLRVLEQGDVHPIGATNPVRVDVRIVAATNRDLRQDVGAGGFRGDLYYRLNVVRVTMPPLREHLEDVPAIAVELVDRPISDNALARLHDHSWPGNVRELRNVLERAAAWSDGDRIEASAIEIDPPTAPEERSPVERVFADALDGTPFDGTILDFRNRYGEEALKELLERAIRTTRDVKQSGRMLGFVTGPDATRQYDNLRHWMRKLGVSKRSVLG